VREKIQEYVPKNSSCTMPRLAGGIPDKRRDYVVSNQRLPRGWISKHVAGLEVGNSRTREKPTRTFAFRKDYRNAEVSWPGKKTALKTQQKTCSVTSSARINRLAESVSPGGGTGLWPRRGYEEHPGAVPSRRTISIAICVCHNF